MNNNALTKAIHDNIVVPALNKRPTGCRAIILEHDSSTRLASIMMNDPVDGTNVVMNYIPVGGVCGLTEDGIKSSRLPSGTAVWVSFLDENTPIIVSVLPPQEEKPAHLFDGITNIINEFFDFY